MAKENAINPDAATSTPGNTGKDLTVVRPVTGPLTRPGSTLSRYVKSADQRRKVEIENIDQLMAIVREQLNGAAVDQIEQVAQEDLGAAIDMLQRWQKTGDVLYENRSQDLQDMKETNAIRRDLYRILELDEEPEDDEESKVLLGAVHGFDDAVRASVVKVSDIVGRRKSRNMIVDAIVKIASQRAKRSPENGNGYANFAASLDAFFIQEGRIEQLLRLLVADEFAVGDKQSAFEGQADALRDDMEAFMTNDLVEKEIAQKGLSGAELATRKAFLSRRIKILVSDFIADLAKIRAKGTVTSLTSSAILGALSVPLSEKELAPYRKFNAADLVNVAFRGEGPDAACYVRIVTNNAEVLVFNPYTGVDTHGRQVQEKRLEKMIPDIRTVELCRVDDVVQLLEDLPEGMQLRATVHEGGTNIDMVIAGQPGRDVTLTAASGKKVARWHIGKGATEAQIGADDIGPTGTTVFRDIVTHLNPGFILEIPGAAGRMQAITGQSHE